MQKGIVQETLLALEIREAQHFENMTVLPLFSAIGHGPSYLTLGEALEQRLLTVKEVDAGGSVPELYAVNGAGVPVLLLDGEELIGAKQNRVVNTTILLDARSETVIPVSCTEQGRWHHVSESFSDSNVVMASRIRARKTRSVSRSLETRACFASDQSGVWGGIAEMQSEAGVSSRTGAMKDVYERRSADLSDYLNSFSCIPGQRGILSFVNGQISGLDFVASEAAYPKLHAKLVKSYAMDALLRQGSRKDMPDLGSARAFIESAAAAPESVFDSVGMGRDHRYESPSAVGSALVCDDTVVHMAFFRVEAGADRLGMASSRARAHFRM